jgi:nucleotide-binding universal stress UspA family protein
MEKQDIKRILVPVDGSEESLSAASFAIEIARKFEAELQLLHVVTINQSMRAIGLYGTSYDDVVAKHIQDGRKEVGKWFDIISKQAAEAGVNMSSEIVDTPISIVGEIVDRAEKNAIDIIVVGTKGKSGFTKLLMGSVATGVITYAPCPVLVVR